MIDPAGVALFIPAGLKKFKQVLFEGFGANIVRQGGRVVRGNLAELDALPDDIVPVVGCWPTELRNLIDGWRARGRKWIFWDRGYARRIFATDLPKGDGSGYYRWHIGAFQLREIREDLPDDRWRALKTDVWPWAKNGRHIVVAEPTETYAKFHRLDGWTEKTVAALKAVTDRPLLLRRKEHQHAGRLLRNDLKGAHCMVTHGSGAAVESVIMGCPVFVHPDSAAALVGQTDIGRIEAPVYPARQSWLNSLAYSQFHERELVDGTLWGLIR